MNIIVCIKRVPETAEADIAVDTSGKAIRTNLLSFGINEWDEYALEEAVQIVEAHGGKVTAVTLGGAESQGILRRALAMGAEEAIHLNDPAFLGGDSYAVATALHAALKNRPFDLLLTGVQAGDDGCAQVGSLLGEFFGLPSACMVTRIQLQEGKARIERELEEGMAEICELDIPAVLTIQTGINEPRYVSIMGIRKAKGKTIREVGRGDLNLPENALGASGSPTELKELFLPPVDKEAQMLGGSMEEIAKSVLSIVKDKGGVA
jgi:electron transfer flavoprotein beta subunit